MVRVPQYQRDVSLAPAFRQDVDARASPDAFGASIGRGMESLSRGMDKAGNVFAQLQELEDTTRAKDADNAYSDWLRESMYGESGFMTLEGKAAVEARKSWEEQAEKKRAEFGKGLTPGAARHYSEASQARRRSALQTGAIHTANSRKEWVRTSSDARAATFADDALVGFRNPAVVAKNINAGLLEIRERGILEGWDSDTLQAKESAYVSGVHKNITLRIAQDDPLAADKYRKENADKLSGADQYELERSLETAVKEETSKREAEAILGGSRSTRPKGARVVGETGPTAARALLLERLAGGHGKEHVDGLDESFAVNLAALFQDAPPHIREGLGIQSGYRTVERQRELWAEAVKKYGSAEAARKWVAPPGRSNHNHGQAVDLSYNGQSLAHAPKEVVDWVHENAGKYGLSFPMAHEPWHVEPGDARSGTVSARSNRVSPRASRPSFDEIEDRLAAIQDSDVRDLTRKRIFTALEVQAKAAEAEEKYAKAELWNYIDQGMTPDQVPFEVRQAAGMSAVSAAWSYLETAAKGRDVDSDETLLYDMRRYAAINPTKFADLDLNDYRGRLSKSAIKELTDLQTTALTDQRKAREEGLTLTTAFSQATTQLEAVGITTTGKKGSARQEAAEQIARFNNALAAEMQAFKLANDNRAPTQADIDSMVNRLLLPVVIKQPGAGWFGGDVRTEGFAFEARNRPDGALVEGNVEYGDIPIDLRRGIGLDLERELGRKPSQAEVVERYETFILNR